MNGNDEMTPAAVIWTARYDERCQLYPGRDCPGCARFCARIGDELPAGQHTETEGGQQ